MRILIVDNFDSFTNNIAQYLYEVSGQQPVILPNDTPIAALGLDQYDAVVLSPGPGHPARPADFGVCSQVLEYARVPVLGVCLGHQGINCFFGGTVEQAPQPVHGYRTRISHAGTGLFSGIPQAFEVVRYHSLICTEVPGCLEVTARSECGLVMGLAHRERPVWGVQFHPESIDSQCGLQILRNFLLLVAEHRQGNGGGARGVVDALAAVGGPPQLSVHHERLAHEGSCADLFSAYFADHSEVFWLDCELSDRPLARYSVMGRCDSDSALSFSYDVQSRRLSLEGPKGRAYLDGDFFELMDQVVRALPVEQTGSVPFPFRGGLVGYLGYELKALAGARNEHRSDLPDALLYLPQHLLIVDHTTGTTYTCQLWGEPIALQQSPTRVRGRVPVFTPGPVAEGELSLADSSAAYMGKVEACLQEITAGESYEICLTNRACLKCEAPPLDSYLRMRQLSPVPYGAFFDTAAFSILSASPETFLSIQPTGRITSRPIKGTRPRGRNGDEDLALKQDLASSTKDRAENLMIVDLVRHDLNGICVPGSVTVPKAFDIESYSSVYQLVSTVQGQLRPDLGSFAAIKACFPGGSMTGAPKVRTMEIIDRLESSARGIYSGALGWIGLDGYTDLSIVIRTAVIKDGIARFGIGGAIVAASDPREEMQETLVKASVPYHSIRGREVSVG
ncbi:aminodeoxychorismate synthase component I [Pseudomonas citronellolis]|uniref:aminodeoxychorismate synthase component I n=1 Tax=Pseudomonas citronellolis TaxID=53408 RepID=UPI0022BA50B8|nr:aminodeoxychorismate synthase component I [Pseudomonas citronellolis]WBG61840.1 aminodeoxychorismate synthase component I [Pseudomonas citronellolis]